MINTTIIQAKLRDIIIKTVLQFQVCQHPHSRLREWAGDALTTLIKRATFYDHKPPLSEDLVSFLLYIILMLYNIFPLRGSVKGMRKSVPT